MPAAVDDEADDRIVLDEATLDFRGLTPAELTDRLEEFNDTLEEILTAHRVAISEWWAEQYCAEGHLLAQFLYERGGPFAQVSRDTRRRTALLLDKCRLWDTALTPDAPSTVRLAGGDHESWSLGHALCRTRDGRTTACLLFPTSGLPTGWQDVSSVAGDTQLYLLRTVSELVVFWRGLYVRENVRESEFRSLAPHAFPRLILASSLSFRRFDGSYRDLREWVVSALAAVNDHFEQSMAEHASIPHQVQAAFGRFGVDVSPESPKTRNNAEAMRQRQVRHDGADYLCEWHAKQHPARNRIHFSLPDQRINGKILVGVFVDHLDT